jgi:molybdopterin molybdotransferase
MKEFFKVTDLETVFHYIESFDPVGMETVPLDQSHDRILAVDVVSDIDLPDFNRSIVDGYAVRASSTFGASDGSPAFITVKDIVGMGEVPDFSLKPGQAASISTGGMLPKGADSVVMIEHTEAIDESTIEVYKSVAPGQHVIESGEDIRNGSRILTAGIRLRPQETGLLAALGTETVKVYRKPKIGIISTGDEIVPVGETPKPGQIRDVNTYTLAGFVLESGGIPVSYGIVRDDFDLLFDICSRAVEHTDMVFISGGSSVGSRDFTVDVLSKLPDPDILVHGISISPGKPTILSKSQNKAIWGLPGHVVSAMVVFKIVVIPFIEHIGGLKSTHANQKLFPAKLSRNLSSAQGRVDYIRVRVIEKEDGLWAEPVLGKSGLIHTMVKADGLIGIDINTEGLDKGTIVNVIPV